jgi:hypothetical protein
MTAKNLYDPERIQKIGEILPGLCQFARSGDEIALGLVGDPEFPTSYRGSRPVGVIESIDEENDATIVKARMEDGTLMSLPSTTIGAFNSWEFTDKGFEKVLVREEERARAESSLRNPPTEYRGASDNIDSRMNQLEDALRRFELTQNSFRKTVVSTFKEVASDVNRLSQTTGSEAKFCSSLSARYEDMMQARAESSFRGASERKNINRYEESSSNVSRNEKLEFSDDDGSLISEEDEEY